MKNKHLWLALGEGLLFMILFLHRYELEWMCWVQMLICIIVGIKVLDHLRAFYEDRRMIGKNKKTFCCGKQSFRSKRVFT